MERECRIDEPVEAAIASGSDYRGAYRVGARVALELEEASGTVIVTRASGAVKIGYLVGPHAELLASCLRLGYRYTGRITDIALGLSGKVLRMRLDPPTR